MPEPVAAGSLTAEHHGWYIRIPADGRVGHRHIKLGGIRRWNDGQDQVGLLDTDDATGSVRGTEHRISPVSECLLIRKLRAGRPRRGAYPPTE